MKLPTPVIDYRKLRLNNITSPEFYGMLALAWMKDKDALLQAMCQMAANPVAAAAMGRNAHRVKERVRLSSIVDQWLTYINKVCQ